MDLSRAAGLNEPEDALLTSELLLDTEYAGYLADPAGGGTVPAAARDLDVLELDQELMVGAETPRHSRSADPCIRVAIAPGPMRPRSADKAAEPRTSTGFVKGALSRQLAEARNQAALAQTTERRSHEALYHAVGCAYDFALAAAAAPAEFALLINDPTLESRKMATTVVKLVFGFDYDKTRVAEYAAVLSFASRLELDPGSLPRWLSKAPGGLKGIVAAERELRRKDEGTARLTMPRLSRSVAARLRKLPIRQVEDLEREGEEFLIIVARREPDGHIAVLGEVPSDISLLKKAANQLIGRSD